MVRKIEKIKLELFNLTIRQISIGLTETCINGKIFVMAKNDRQKMLSG